MYLLFFQKNLQVYRFQAYMIYFVTWGGGEAKIFLDIWGGGSEKKLEIFKFSPIPPPPPHTHTLS